MRPGDGAARNSGLSPDRDLRTDQNRGRNRTVMRLWHQSFAQLDKMPAYNSALKEHLKKVSAPGTEIVMHGMAPGTHTTMQPGKDIGYSYIQHLHSLQFLESVMQAEKEGYDAYLLSTL